MGLVEIFVFVGQVSQACDLFIEQYFQGCLNSNCFGELLGA